jgi:hypothetical protein
MEKNGMNTKEIFNKSLDIWGMYPPTDAFIKLVKENLKPGLVVAELGCFDGATTKYILPMIKEVEGLYYAIDWFMGTFKENLPTNLDENTNRHYYRDEYDKVVYPFFLKNIEETGCSDICNVLKGKTEDMVHLIQDKSLDICFIDADHSYEAVVKDIELYLPKVKDGGILCGHDYDGEHPDVIRAVNEKFSNISVRECDNKQLPIWIKND